MCCQPFLADPSLRRRGTAAASRPNSVSFRPKAASGGGDDAGHHPDHEADGEGQRADDENAPGLPGVLSRTEVETMSSQCLLASDTSSRRRSHPGSEPRRSSVKSDAFHFSACKSVIEGLVFAPSLAAHRVTGREWQDWRGSNECGVRIKKFSKSLD